MRLTKRAVDGLKPTARRQVLYDDDLKGFGLVVQPSGVRSYFCRYYLPSGRERRLTLGRHGELTPVQARRLAADVLAQVRAGGDPLGERKQARDALTVAKLVEVYRQRHLAKRKPTTRREYERLLEKVILPTFGRRRLAEVTTTEVAAWHARQPSPYAANRALAVLRSLFELAAKWQLRDPGHLNPAAYVERNPEKGRERYLDSGELARFGSALDAVEADEPRSRAAVAALRLLLLTGARRNEVLTLRWENLDRANGCAWLSDSKTGRRPLLISAPAWQVLDGVAAEYDVKPRKGWVLPSYRKRGSHLADVRKTFAEVCKRAKLEGLRLHDLRHTNASAAAGEGLSLPLVGKLLGHKRASTRYAHLADDPARQAAHLVQGRLAERLASEPEEAEVRELKR